MDFDKKNFWLDPEEYSKICSEINNEYYSKYMGKSIAAHCSYGIDGVPYVYWFENHGFNDYRIIIREVDYR